MKQIYNNIKEYKLMYYCINIGITSHTIGNFMELNNALNYNGNNSVIIDNIRLTNYFIYSHIVTNYGGVTNLKIDLKEHYFTKINEIIYENIKNKEIDKEKIDKDIKKKISEYKTSDITIDIMNLNGLKIMDNNGNKSKYYSLLYMAIPFALKINDKKKLIKELVDFIKKYTNDDFHILSVLSIGLFIHYAIMEIDINKWIKNLINDIDNEKYIEYINEYYENNFRNNEFIERKSHEFIAVRNDDFFKTYCNKENKILTQNPEEQVLLIYDTIVKCKGNWEQLILYGMTNYNENISISLILGLLYEIIFSYSKINKNLLKRFSF